LEEALARRGLHRECPRSAQLLRHTTPVELAQPRLLQLRRHLPEEILPDQLPRRPCERFDHPFAHPLHPPAPVEHQQTERKLLQQGEHRLDVRAAGGRTLVVLAVVSHAEVGRGVGSREGSGLLNSITAAYLSQCMGFPRHPDCRSPANAGTPARVRITVRTSRARPLRARTRATPSRRDAGGGDPIHPETLWICDACWS